jgi:nucleotide-binding universal stress UspA family protein
MHILVVHTDSPFWDQALCFAQQLCRALAGTYVALGVAPDARQSLDLRQSLAAGLPTGGQEGTAKVRQGDIYQQVLEEIDRNSYDLVLLGADVERPGDLHHSPTAEYVAQQSQVPVGIVHSCPQTWDRVLICARAPDPALPVSRRGTALAARLNAVPTVLHVIQPPHYSEAPPLDLPLGLPNGLIKVRYGPVQREIRAEIESGTYQVAIVGAHIPVPEIGREEVTLARPDIMRQVLDLQLPVVIVIGHQPQVPEPDKEASGLGRHPLRRMIGYVVAEVAVYGVLVVAYAAVAFRFLVDRLNDWFHHNPSLYAVLALLLIVGQGILLEELTSFLLDRLRLERFE